MVNDLDDVGARLTVDNQEDCRATVRESIVARVSDGINDVCDVRHTDHCAVVISHYQRLVLICLEKLIGSVYLPMKILVGERSLGAVCIGGSEGGRHFIDAYAKFAEQGGVYLSANRGAELPPTRTCPTPSICAIFCARMESATSYMWGLSMVADVIVMIMMGDSAGFVIQ